LSIAVLGIGSAHGDDQIGWYLLDQLSERGKVGGAVLEKINAPGASLLSCLQRYEQIVVIDACQMEAAVGAFKFIDHAEDSLLSLQADAHYSSHSFSLVDAWKLAQKLSLPLPQISLFLVQIQQTKTMSRISDEILQRVPEYSRELERIVKFKLA
jgi:hydrogenase maturation protease